MNDRARTALYYLRNFGFSVIPVGTNKKPLIAWTEYQTRKPSEQEIIEWFTIKYHNANIGIVTGMVSGIAVIDIDTKEGYEEIMKYIPDSLLIPTVVTPSGWMHLYFRMPDTDLRNNARTIPGCDFRGNGGYVVAPNNVLYSEIDGKSYYWQTGCKITEVELPELPQTYIDRIQKPGRRTHVCDSLVNIPLFSEGRRDNDLFHLANYLVKSGMSASEIAGYLGFIMNSWGEHDERWINTKIESALKRNENNYENLAAEIREWVLSTSGHFLSTDVHRFFNLSTRVHKKNCSEVLRRLASEGVIERDGKKHGQFRKVEGDFHRMELIDKVIPRVDIKWPFAIENIVYTLPKNITVIAGVSDAGKSAFMLNFAYNNRNYPKGVRYLSSEMGEDEIIDRITLSDLPREEWKKIDFIERSSNFKDLILPDAINIVDFLEIHEDFSRISLFIKEIFDKLKNGIALISIQKKYGCELGRGAEFSMEKARLYLSFDSGKLTIAKGKNWMNHDKKPTGLTIDFKLVKGFNFIPVSGWKRKENNF